MDIKAIFLCFVLIYIQDIFGASLLSRRTKRSVRCFPHDVEIGCFSNEYPFNNSEGALPLSAENLRTNFLLTTESNRNHPRPIVRHDIQNLNTSGFDPSLPTKFIIHGFVQNGRVRWIRNMARELLQKERMNVIAVDWGWGSGWPYTQAVANTRLAGAHVAALIWFLNNATGTTNAQYHLIGHSLGAHVAGYAGARLPGLNRISGLDPAQPNFKNTPPVVRLDASDADFVDVIHTDGSNFDTISGYGLFAAVGDVDFYPNGGKFQPGCPQESWTSVVEDIDRGYQRMGNDLACSHSRSIILFTESINSQCRFRSFPCDNYQNFLQGQCFSCGNRPCPIMGYDADRYRATGKHYLSTAVSPPYCGYHYHVSMEFGRSMSAENGEISFNILGSRGLSEIFSINTTTQAFMPSQIRNTMFVSHSDVGDVVQVQVKFQHTGGVLHRWIWGSEVSIRSITIQRGKTDNRWIFCGNNEPLRTGETRGFHTIASSLTECRSDNIQVVHM